jgi:hypothetical protein
MGTRRTFWAQDVPFFVSSLSEILKKFCKKSYNLLISIGNYIFLLVFCS